MQNELKEKTGEVEELSIRLSELELSESCDLIKSKTFFNKYTGPRGRFDPQPDPTTSENKVLIWISNQNPCKTDEVLQ